MLEVSVASFNVHGGVDGWGRPFDLVGACRALDADVLVLQELWTPAEGGGAAQELASALGYRLSAVPMAPARRYPASSAGAPDWGPLLRSRTPGVGVQVERGAGHRRARPPGPRGWLGIALLERRPASPGVVEVDPPRAVEVLELGRMAGDPARRVALRTGVGGEGGEPALTVVGTHLAHIRHGSLLHLRRLARVLPRGDSPGVLVGDMNMWGAPLVAMLPGWSRAVVGPTWPAWRPLFQIDHVLVTGPVRVLDAEVVQLPGSDHLPVRARLAVG